MGGDIRAVSPVQVAALERLWFLVKVGRRTVPQSFPFGSLRLPRVPLGGFATSRSPMAAVAARGAVHNPDVSDDSRDLAHNHLPHNLLLPYSPLHTGNNLSLAIEDFDTHHFYSPLRGNMGSYVHQWQCKGSLSSTRSPYKVVRPSVNTGNRRNCVKASLPQLRRHGQ